MASLPPANTRAGAKQYASVSMFSYSELKIMILRLYCAEAFVFEGKFASAFERDLCQQRSECGGQNCYVSAWQFPRPKENQSQSHAFTE